MSEQIRTQLTEQDWALLHMMRGSHWGPGATLVLPSGISLSGDEVAALLPNESSGRTQDSSEED